MTVTSQKPKRPRLFRIGQRSRIGRSARLSPRQYFAVARPDLQINWNLGKTLPEVLNNAYDNPAIAMMVYGFSPGLPMDFINCTMRAPWGFLRNTDDRYGVKVVAEEAGFLDWQIEPHTYAEMEAFPRGAVRELSLPL